MNQFRHDTGIKWTPSLVGINALIDQATGANTAFFREFAKWMNENIWGPHPVAGEE